MAEYDVTFADYHGDAATYAEGMEHSASVVDMDRHFIIDGIPRTATNANDTKKTLVQFDHKSERFTFEMPKTIEGHDMSLCDKVEVHFVNTDGKRTAKGSYTVDDISVSGDNVTFSWLVYDAATKIVGNLDFWIVFECTVDGEVDYRWSTLKHKGITVAEGADGEYRPEENKPVTSVTVTKSGDTVTANATYKDGSSSTSVITLVNDEPVKVVKDGVTCNISWEGF